MGQILSDGSETNGLEFVTIPVSKIIYKSIINMEDISQVFNQLLGRQEDYNGVAYWEEPERCGWLMKQGTRVCYVDKEINTCIFLSKASYVHCTVRFFKPYVYVCLYYRRVSKVLEKAVVCAQRWEVVLVQDGSCDS